MKIRSSSRRILFLLWIIVLVSAIVLAVLPKLGAYIAEDTRHHRAYEDLHELSKSVEEYRAATGVYPTTEEGFDVMIRKPDPAPSKWQRIIKVVPIDPWANRYCYRLASREGKETPEVLSCGRDGTLGTEDDLSSLDE